jgi:hypothetical protein
VFDTVTGLPVHVLVVHAVVVIGPLAALLLLLYVGVPRWRTGLRWPTVLAAVAAVGAGVVAGQSGEELQERLETIGRETALIEAHTEAGERATVTLWILLGVTLLVVFLLAPARSEDGGVRRALAIVLAVVAAGVALYGVVAAGHSGSEAVWTEIVRNTG